MVAVQRISTCGWCATTEDVEVWSDVGWCAATKGVEMQNDIGWCTTTKGVEVWNHKKECTYEIYKNTICIYRHRLHGIFKRHRF